MANSEKEIVKNGKFEVPVNSTENKSTSPQENQSIVEKFEELVNSYGALSTQTAILSHQLLELHLKKKRFIHEKMELPKNLSQSEEDRINAIVTIINNGACCFNTRSKAISFGAMAPSSYHRPRDSPYHRDNRESNRDHRD